MCKELGLFQVRWRVNSECEDVTPKPKCASERLEGMTVKLHSFVSIGVTELPSVVERSASSRKAAKYLGCDLQHGSNLCKA